METQDITLTSDMIPLSFVRCFQADCPQAGSCARYLAGRHIPDYVTQGSAVFPTSRQADGSCRHYKQTRVVRFAYGFSTLFAEVKAKDSPVLRAQVRKYLGGKTTYYRFHSGERKLTPEKQEYIIALFRRHGYTDRLYFDHYCYMYDFT